MARMSRNHQLDLPPLELKCMQALWTLGEGSVHEIRSRLITERPLAYTTIMTVMDRLARKGIVGRKKLGRAHRYRPLFAEDRVRAHAVDRLVEKFFRGSREGLRQFLATGKTPGGKPKSPGPPPARRREPEPVIVEEAGIDTALL